MQDMRNSSALAMEWRLSCITPSIWTMFANFDLIYLQEKKYQYDRLMGEFHETVRRYHTLQQVSELSA